ncbi:hypothetical protein N0V85_004199 [Neurospora sp. IMI 360204]|nr:hypothetical protein N0V85_004199 [Neurospora sp. IMI 360204]
MLDIFDCLLTGALHFAALVLNFAISSVYSAFLGSLASLSKAWSLAWSLLQAFAWFFDKFQTFVDLVTLLSVFSGLLSVFSGLFLLFRGSNLIVIGLEHRNTRKVCREIGRYAVTVWSVASKGVSAWKVFSQWVIRSSQAVCLRQRRTGKAYIVLDEPTPSPPITIDNQTVDQFETTVEHQDVPQYLLCQREGWQGPENLDVGHLVNRSTREDTARPIASSVILEQAAHPQVAESTNAASAFDVVYAGSTPPRPSKPDRVKHLELLKEKTARECGLTVEQLEENLLEGRSSRTVEEAAPSTTAPDQSQLPETDKPQEQSLRSGPYKEGRLDADAKVKNSGWYSKHRPFNKSWTFIPKPEPPVFSPSSSFPPSPVPTPKPVPTTAPASQPTPVEGACSKRVQKKMAQWKSRRSVLSRPYDLFHSDSVYELMAPEALHAVAVSKPVVAKTHISEPVVRTEPSVAPEPILAVKLTPPEIVITPPSPVLAPQTEIPAEAQVVVDNGISSMPDKLAPEPTREIVTAPSVPTSSVVSQLQLGVRDTVSEQEIEVLRLRFEDWQISPSVDESASVDDQKTVGNGVQSPLQVPVLTTLASPADDLLPSVVVSVEDSIVMEPVSARPSDDDVEMEEDLSVLSLAGPEFNGVALSSDDQHMQDGDDSHQVWMHEESPVVSSDMELFPPQQSPETVVFGGQVVPLVSFDFQQPSWQFSSVFDGQFNFTTPSLVQPQGPEHDMVDAPQPDMVLTPFEGPMVDMTSPADSFQADTTMEGHFDYPAPPAFSPGQQQQPWNFVQQPTPATSDRVPVSDTIDFDMGSVYPDINTLNNVVSPMAPQPSPVSVTTESDMGLGTPAHQAVVSPVAPEQKPVVSDITEFSNDLVDPQLFGPIDMPTQGIAPAVEQPTEQVVSQPVPAADEFPGVEECNPEEFAKLQALLEQDAEEANRESEYPDLPEPAEVNQTPEVASPSFTPDVDDGASDSPLVLSPPGTPRSWDHSLFGSPPPVFSAPTPPNRSPTPPPPAGLDFTNATFQPILPVGAPVFTPAPTFQPILPVGAPIFNQAPSFPDIRIGQDFIVHVPDTPDDPEFHRNEAEWTEREMARMEQAFRDGQRLTQADVASAKLRVDVLRPVEHVYVYGADEEDEDSDGSIESSDREVVVSVSQRKIIVPMSRASRATATATATPSVPPAAPLNVAPVADMGSVGEITPPVVSDLPGEEHDADRELTADEPELLGMASEDEDDAPQQIADGSEDRDPRRQEQVDYTPRADVEVIRTRKLAAPRRRRNLLPQNNTGN